jgi:hypothetical protein
VITSCWCGINLAVPDALYRHAKQTENNHIFCPLGHKFVFGDTYEKQLKRQQAETERMRQRMVATRELLEAEERSHTATRGHLTRQRKRAKEGVCPCCHRTFKQLAAHMKNKHPEFEPEATPTP